MMPCITLLGLGLATPDEGLRELMPFPAPGVDRDAIPPLLRRRTSQATQLAFSAASQACSQAGRSPGELPAVFATVGGEIQVTDAICLDIGTPGALISPTAFHNSVHNTAAGYWSIMHRCTRAAAALAAGHETLAMALLEAWCILATQGGEILLVCYDERWPLHLAAPMGAPPFAAAMVLGAGRVDPGMATIGRPHTGMKHKLPEAVVRLVEKMPVIAIMPLLTALAEREKGKTVPLSISSPTWVVEVTTIDNVCQ
jgi:hypothetical protein